MMQPGTLLMRSKASSTSWKAPNTLRFPALDKIRRQIRAHSNRLPDFIVLPSAPPLRDDVRTVERLPHQRSVDLEASTSTPQTALAAGTLNQTSQWISEMNFGWLLQPKSALLLGGLLGGVGFDTSKPSSVLQAVGVLALIVTVHEAGHFLAARLQGIRVSRFAVGFGPTLFKFKANEVEYCLNAVPLGGYVAFPDDEMVAGAQGGTPTDGDTPAASQQQQQPGGGEAAATTVATTANSSSSSGDPRPAPEIRPDDPDLLKNRPLPQRALVITAGVIANVLFAYLVLLAQITSVGKAETAFLPGVRVMLPDASAAAASPAVRGGLLTGDVILRIGDVIVPAGPSQVSDSVAAIRAAAGRELQLTVQRPGPGRSKAAERWEGADSTAAAEGSGRSGGEVLSLRVVPDTGPNGQGRLGVQLASNTFIQHTYPGSAVEVLSLTQSEFNRLSGTVINGLKQILTNFSAMSGQLSGPVAIVAAGSEVVRMDSAGLFQFAAIVNINLAAVNILPLPALDGGYLLLLAVEALRGGRKLPPGVEQGYMASGFLLLTALGIGLVIKDTLNLL